MIPREILKKVRRIDITTRGLVNDVFSGEYHSVFKGRGVSFAEVREYAIGDDVRTIDWNVSARMGHPYVKVFEEERELTVMLAVDASASGDFGTVERMKRELAVEICALLAFSAIKNNDKVGLILFTDHVEKFVPPRKGRRHVHLVLRELLCFEPTGKGTDLAAALQYLGRILRRRSVAFLVSDFLAEGYEKALRVAARRHDLIAVSIADPREAELPNVGLVELEDAETGRRVIVNTRDAGLRSRYREASERLRARRRKLLRSTRVDAVEVWTDRSYVESLIRFFRRRARRFR